MPMAPTETPVPDSEIPAPPETTEVPPTPEELDKQIEDLQKRLQVLGDNIPEFIWLSSPGISSNVPTAYGASLGDEVLIAKKEMLNSINDLTSILSDVSNITKAYNKAISESE